MTCREKLKLEHPDLVNNTTIVGGAGCPSSYGYAPDPLNGYGACDRSCDECWDREVENKPETIDEPKPEKKDRIVIVKLNVAAKADRYNAIVEELTKQLNDGLIVLPPFCELVFVSDGDLKFDIQDGGSDES